MIVSYFHNFTYFAVRRLKMIYTIENRVRKTLIGMPTNLIPYANKYIKTRRPNIIL